MDSLNDDLIKNLFFSLIDIDNTFKRSPQDATEFQTKSHKFDCIPPEGYPKPRIVEWRKDGNSLFQISDDKATKEYKEGWLVYREGKVRILSFWTRLDSAGVYTCVAQNSEGLRESRPARLTVKGSYVVYLFFWNIKIVIYSFLSHA